jgi:hypothetical protein
VVTAAQVRKVALSMPHAEEHSHHGHPDFRVNGKIFATLRPAERRAVVKLPLADQAALLQMDPKAFSLNAWSHQGFTDMHLKQITPGQLRRAIQAAWRNVAPRRLVASFSDD